MGKRIVIVEGHPDGKRPHFGHALADAYAKGAEAAGHEVRRIVVAELDFPLLTSKDEWEKGSCPDCIRAAQDTIRWAEHLVILYPLWLGCMPALLKAFFEQAFRPGFALDPAGKAGFKPLRGRSARVVVTMGMPAFFYQWFYRAHSLKSLKRNILAFVGIGPVASNVIGMIESKRAGKHDRWLNRMAALGSRAR